MRWLNKLKIGGKLILGFGVMIVLMGAIGFEGWVSSRSIQHSLEDIFAVRMPSIDYLIEADRDLQQLLVAERSMIFTNAKSDVFKQLVADYEENYSQATRRIDKYKALAATAEEKKILAAFDQAWAGWSEVSRRVVDGRVADTRQGRREALDLTLGQANEKFEEMRDYIDQLTGINLKLAETAHETSLADYHTGEIVSLSVIAFGVLLGLFLMWRLGRGVTRPLKGMIEGLTHASEQVSAGSEQIVAASQTLAQGASEQAAGIEETSSSLEEMASMTRQNADNAVQADQLMQTANQVVTRANDTMRQLTGSMVEISTASEETQKIVKTIDEIAFQTNLLALNAAVEAARAGEAGAGFAVVADEVRNLAMRAAEAAKNTADLIEGTVQKVQGGSRLVEETDKAFGEVADNAAKVGQLVSEIAAASREQAQGIEQVNQAVTDMDKVTQSNAANAEESAGSAESMRSQASELLQYVEDLKEMVGGAKTVSPSGPSAQGSIDRKKGPPASAKAVAADPQQLIPLDDAFDDF